MQFSSEKIYVATMILPRNSLPKGGYTYNYGLNYFLKRK
jgi:urease accessory protein UreF